LKLLQRVDEVDGRASPPGELGHQDGVELSSLCEPHDSLPLDPVRLGPRGGLLEDPHDLVARALGEVAEIALLPVAVLVRGGDSAVDGGSRLSQLKSLGNGCPRCSPGAGLRGAASV